MSARRVADTGFSLPPNPSYIEFPRSDGNLSTWPPNTTRVVDHEGNVNFYQHVDMDHHQNKKWRVSVGDAISLGLKMPDGPSYVLKDFPAGYRLYDHNKGPESAPRHDLYLFGPTKKRFRSINEFIPHAIWLMGEPSTDCECKYCAKKSQREITASLSNILRTTPTQSPGPGPTRTKTAREKGKGRDPGNRPKEARHRDTRVYAAVQKTAEPLKPSPDVLKQPMLVERSNDLRSAFSKASRHIPRWPREGEVMWCALNPPIKSPDSNATLEYWPGIVEEITLKSIATPRGPPNGTSDSGLSPTAPQASTSAIPHVTVNASERGPILDPTADPLPWKIHQYNRYKVQLLAISHWVTYDNADILPYQVYMPPTEIIQLLTDFPVEKLDFSKTSLSKFTPYSESGPVSILEAIPPYAVALQIASALSSFWCLTDSYEVKYQIPPTPEPPSQATVPPPSMSITSHQSSVSQPSQNLGEVIEAASRRNAQLSKATNGYYDSVAAVNAESSASAGRTARHVLGAPPSPEQLSQTRFQGLWWGAERIWTGDFIRLKFPRRTIAPNGGNHILPPAGLGQSSLAAWHNSPRDTAELGAGMRAVFLRINGIMAVDVPTPNGFQKEARICGMLYELADEDWVDPDVPLVRTGSLNKSSPSATQSTAPTFQNGTNADIAVEPGNTSTVGPPMPMDLPPAPIKYKFRPILEPGFEFVGAMGLISGRYYPRVLSHPRMVATVNRALSQSGDVVEANHLWALEGLSGGYFNSIDPTRYKKSRLIMMLDADKEAISALQQYKEARIAEQEANVTGEGGTGEMDVDDIY